jgi:hypothetical protein
MQDLANLIAWYLSVTYPLSPTMKKTSVCSSFCAEIVSILILGL